MTATIEAPSLTRSTLRVWTPGKPAPVAQLDRASDYGLSTVERCAEQGKRRSRTSVRPGIRRCWLARLGLGLLADLPRMDLNTIDACLSSRSTGPPASGRGAEGAPAIGWRSRREEHRCRPCPYLTF
jgi:hypothetical protein